MIAQLPFEGILAYPGISLIMQPTSVNSLFQSLLLPEVTDLFQLRSIPDGKRDDVCSEIHEMD